jgi:hypothetical protein
MKDNETKILIKKGFLKIQRENFTEQVMERIQSEAAGNPQTSKYIKLSWFCITLAGLILPFGLQFIFRLFSLYDPFVVQYLQTFSESVAVQVGFVLLMTVILLIQLDNLIGMSYFRKKWSFQLIH